MNIRKEKCFLRSLLVMCFLLFLAGTKASSEPTLGTQCQVFRPEFLKKYIVKESELSKLTASGKKKKSLSYGQDGPKTGEFWYVYSDRSDNTTYESPSVNSTKCGSLDFNEEVVIAKIEGDFALVYTEPGAPVYPQISRRAKSRGWIPMNHLLLWNSCPANEKGIYNKAIIVGNIDSSPAQMKYHLR